MNSKDLANEVIIEITEEEYEADLARGLEKDEVLQPGQHRFRRGGFLARHRLKSEQIATPVKAQINHALRIFMEREQSTERMTAHSTTYPAE